MLTMFHYQFNFVPFKFSRIYKDTEDSLITQLRKCSAVTVEKCIRLGDKAQHRLQEEEGVGKVPFCLIIRYITRLQTLSPRN